MPTSENPFRVSDESLNTYGLRISSAGGDFSQFELNPVMLHDHRDYNLPIGTWKDLKVLENADILATPVFDIEDPDAAKIKGKVDRGIIKMASIGVIPLEFNEEVTIVTKWILREISITTFGSNKNAFRLYDRDLKPIELNSRDDVLKLSATTTNLNKNETMTDTLKVTLLAGLNLSAKTTDADLIRNVIQLHQENEAAKATIIGLNQKITDSEKKANDAKEAIELKEKTDYLKLAADQKVITAKQIPAYQKMELADIKVALADVKAPVNLSAVPNDAGKTENDVWARRQEEINANN